MIFKKIFSLVASTIKLFIFFLLISNSIADENKKFSNDKGILSIMYHRFEENKYPSTNIKMDIFKKHMSLINERGYNFFHPKEFQEKFFVAKKEKEILLTIDDAFSSFYNNAWPYLKKNKIPFILFVSTEHIGKTGYMTWSQIKEIENEEFGFIGNHSHSHDYLINFTFDEFKSDIDKSIKIFTNNLGYNPRYFSYPFGEYSLKQKNYIKNKFDIAFGQHSGVIDINKDFYELPRFPINEKYGDLERFKFLLNLYPLEYKSISIKDMLILEKNNPPKFHIKFFKEQTNLKNINCFSNEGGDWKDTNIKLEEEKLYIILKEKFKPRRGRINCSLKENDTWKWLGLQFVIK